MENDINMIVDEHGHPIVVLSGILFRNKQSIDWSDVERFLRKYVGKIVVMTESKDIIYIGKDFPDEYKGSSYTRGLKGARAKAKANAKANANAVQGILEMITYATNKKARINKKEKHVKAARNGWYYYTVRFAVPIYQGEIKTEEYNVYSGCLLVNHANNGRKYLYDLVDIKKEASTPLKLTT